MTMKLTGVDSFAGNFDKLAKDISKINNMALYEAAGYVADELRRALEAMPTYTERDEHRLYGATPSEKKQIIANLGISTFKKDSDGVQTAIGFNGYVNTPSRRFNDQVPTGMLMQCIEYGTEFRKGTHTISRAEKQIKNQAIQKAQDTITEEIKKIMD